MHVPASLYALLICWWTPGRPLSATGWAADAATGTVMSCHHCCCYCCCCWQLYAKPSTWKVIAVSLIVHLAPDCVELQCTVCMCTDYARTLILQLIGWKMYRRVMMGVRVCCQGIIYTGSGCQECDLCSVHTGCHWMGVISATPTSKGLKLVCWYLGGGAKAQGWSLGWKRM